jgi:hypothetical protein
MKVQNGIKYLTSFSLVSYLYLFVVDIKARMIFDLLNGIDISNLEGSGK